MWSDIEKVKLSEDHYENFFYWPLLAWINHNFTSGPPDPATNLTVLKPSRFLEGRQYHSDLVIYGEYPFLLQYKCPKRPSSRPHVLRYDLNGYQHNQLVDIAKTYPGVFACYALPIINEYHLRFPQYWPPFSWPNYHRDLEDHLWFMDIGNLKPQFGRHHIEIELQNGRPQAKMCSIPEEAELINIRMWKQRLKARRSDTNDGGKAINQIIQNYPRLKRNVNLLIDAKLTL